VLFDATSYKHGKKRRQLKPIQRLLVIPKIYKEAILRSYEYMHICLIHPMYRERYWKCDNYLLSNIEFRSNNLLLLYPPFIEIFLNQSMIRNYIFFTFTIRSSENVIDIDLPPLNHLRSSFKFELTTDFPSHPTHILFKTYPWFKRKFSLDYKKDFYYQFVSQWHITYNTSSNTNDVICYNFTTTQINDTSDIYYNVSYSCPSDKCLTDKSETRVCIGSTPCLYMGDETLLCRIERLQANDQFNVHTSFLYSDLIIITTDDHKDTLHTFSENLLKSCITQRLLIVIIHGRLEIPSLNSTSFHCSSGLVYELLF
jgi:hypothetical protein